MISVVGARAVDLVAALGRACRRRPPWRPARRRGARPRCRRTRGPPRAPCRRGRRRSRAGWPRGLARRDQRGHAAHRERAAGVAGLHEPPRVGRHERHRHLHVVAIGQHELRPVAEALDHREDVVPAPGVQAVGVVAQLVEDLLHLEGGRQCLDEHGRPERRRSAGRAPPARRRTRRSTAGPRGGAPSSAGTGTAPSRGRAAAARRGTRTGRSPATRPRTARRRRREVLLVEVPAPRAHEQRRGTLARARTAAPPSSRT